MDRTKMITRQAGHKPCVRVAVFILALVLWGFAWIIPAGTDTVRANASTVTSWDGTTKEDFTQNQIGAGGSEANPYLISNGAQLAFLAEQVNSGDTDLNGKHFKLSNDIDLGDEPWTPIGNDSDNNHPKFFYGTFEGDNHTIYGLNVTQPNLLISPGITTAYAGLFGFVGSPFSGYPRGYIKNLSVKGKLKIETSYSGYCGGVAGRSIMATITNCSFDGTINIKSDDSYFCVGGIVGYATYDTNISECYHLGRIIVNNTSGDVSIGGIVGSIADSSIKECYNTGDISGSGNDNYTSCSAGGITAWTVAQSSLSDCFNTGNITCDNSGEEEAYAGGIAGVTTITAGETSCGISYCYTIGKNGTEDLYVIGANNSGSVTESYYLSAAGSDDASTVGQGLGTPKTETQLKTTDTFQNWNRGIWSISDGKYPFLNELPDPYSITSSVDPGPTHHVDIPYIPPFTEENTQDKGDGGISEDIIKGLADIPEGGSVTIDMNGSTELPAQAVEAIKGKDINLVLDMGGGIKWMINGKDVTDSSKPIDLTVNIDSSLIPAEVINRVTDERYVTQISMGGLSGLKAILTLPMRKQDKGLFANLFRYLGNSAKSLLAAETGMDGFEFISSGKINEDGSVDLEIDGTKIETDEGEAASFAVVVDDHSLDPSIETETPLTLKATSKKGKVTLSWNDVRGATKYRVYQVVNKKNKLLAETDRKKFIASKAYTTVKKNGKKTLKLKKLITGKKYTFFVKAYIDGKWRSITTTAQKTVKVKN